MLGFAAFGHTSGSIVAGVVLYRLISNWGLVPIGWAAIAAADTQEIEPARPLGGRSTVLTRGRRTFAVPLDRGRTVRCSWKQHLGS